MSKTYEHLLVEERALIQAIVMWRPPQGAQTSES